MHDVLVHCWLASLLWRRHRWIRREWYSERSDSGGHSSSRTVRAKIATRPTRKNWQKKQLNERTLLFDMAMKKKMSGSDLICQRIAHLFVGNTYYFQMSLSADKSLGRKTLEKKSCKKRDHLSNIRAYNCWNISVRTTWYVYRICCLLPGSHFEGLKDWRR